MAYYDYKIELKKVKGKLANMQDVNCIGFCKYNYETQETEVKEIEIISDGLFFGSSELNEITREMGKLLKRAYIENLNSYIKQLEDLIKKEESNND